MQKITYIPFIIIARMLTIDFLLLLYTIRLLMKRARVNLEFQQLISERVKAELQRSAFALVGQDTVPVILCG